MEWGYLLAAEGALEKEIEMIEFFAYLFCGFWGHDYRPEKLEQIVKTDSQDTANYRDVCKRCGDVGETYGITHVGPFSFDKEAITHD